MPHGDNTYIRTFTGRRYWPLYPHAADVDVVDIAHALAYKCRYAGHVRRFYSVAEHAVRLKREADVRRRTWAERYAALHHDDGEGYLPDIARPVKKAMPGFYDIERANELVICHALGVQYPFPDIVHELDSRALTDEMMALLPYRDWDGELYGHGPGTWRYGKPLGLPGDELGWEPEVAMAAFLAEHYAMLAEKRDAEEPVHD